MNIDFIQVKLNGQTKIFADLEDLTSHVKKHNSGHRITYMLRTINPERNCWWSEKAKSKLKMLKDK